MVDFTTPNLCGASEEFNKLAGQFSSIKDSLQGSLEGEIDALKGELTASLAVLEADIKGLIPELPSTQGSTRAFLLSTGASSISPRLHRVGYYISHLSSTPSKLPRVTSSSVRVVDGVDRRGVPDVCLLTRSLSLVPIRHSQPFAPLARRVTPFLNRSDRSDKHRSTVLRRKGRPCSTRFLHRRHQLNRRP